MQGLQSLILLALWGWLGAAEIEGTVLAVIDGDTVDTTAGRVRLRWIDTPESRDNAHGQRMPEGAAATLALRQLLPTGATVALWAPGPAVERDRYQRLLAVVTPAGSASSAQEAMIRAGWSPYWRKYGDAPEPYHAALLAAQAAAESASAGGWATAPGYMRDKANERTHGK
jgi:endonuclease YncB( thermonuclease family)